MIAQIVSYKFFLVLFIFLLHGQTPAVHFTDVTEQSGLREATFCGGRERDHLLESVGNGAAFVDYDGDGNLDIFVVSGWGLEADKIIKQVNHLYRNLGNGTFSDVTQEAGAAGNQWGVGVCAADYDGDGWMDLYVTNFGPNALYHNNGDGTFTDAAQQAGVADARWGEAAAFFDADGDSDLDLYLSNYVDASLSEVITTERSFNWRGLTKVMVGPRGLPGLPDVFYQNNGDGTFTDNTEEAGLVDVFEAYGMGVCATDYDQDGDIDLYVANDAQPNFLYQNNGDGTFMEVGLVAGVSLAGFGEVQASMGVDFGDFDNDGDFDAVATNYTGEYSTIYRNLGNGFFDDVAEEVGLAEATYQQMSWGVGFFDADNDTDLDLFIANGHIYPQVDSFPQYGESYNQLNQFFLNEQGHFKEYPLQGIRLSSRGVAFGDYDNDGDVDILVTNIDAPPTLLRNDGDNRNSWLTLKLVGTKSNKFAIGAIVRATTGKLTQVREVRSGNSYASQNDMRVHFGLGDSIKVDQLEVIWPNGQVTQLSDIPVRQEFTIRQEKAGNETKEAMQCTGTYKPD